MLEYRLICAKNDFKKLLMADVSFAYLFSVVDTNISPLNEEMILLNSAIYRSRLIRNEPFNMGSNNREYLIEINKISDGTETSIGITNIEKEMFYYNFI